MKIGIALLIIAVIMCILILIFSFGMVQFITRPEKWSLEDFKKRIEDDGVSFECFLKSRREVFNVYSDYGYELHGFLMKQENPTDRYVILTHGYSGNRWESLAYANIYYELGYMFIFMICVIMEIMMTAKKAFAPWGAMSIWIS